jgi:NOL1/NOP2/sun family putative RNA methylase
LPLPTALIDSLENVPGFDKRAFEAVHEGGPVLTSVRINPAKINGLENFNPGWHKEKIPWSSHGFYLRERPSFTIDPLFHAGAYYVQEASSMFLEEALKQTVDLAQPLRVLDLCAAPGGKSTLIQSMISAESLLVSNEVIKTRVNILSENMSKWGGINTIVTNNDPRDFQRLPGYFDVIVADAPCSGSGLFRKDPEAVKEWSENNVLLCSERQQRILADAMPALREGGILIYSTCSYSLEEDEHIMQWLLDEFKMEGIQLKTAEAWNIVETVTGNGYGYRFYPDKLKGEGFFIAVFRKTGDSNNKNNNRKAQKIEKPAAKEIPALQSYLLSNELLYFKQQDEVVAFPQSLEEDLSLIKSNLYIKKAGVKMGTLIRGELVPDHELALSTRLHPALPGIDVDLETALQYLRKETFPVDSTNKGWALIKYKSIALGWVKILPGRINNYYPANWRILNK